MTRLSDLARNRGERIEYARYITTLVTVNRGTIVGGADQHLPEVVAEHYGDRAGYLPWSRDGFVGLIVDPAVQQVERRVCEGEARPFGIVTRQQVIDWVLSMKQEPVTR